MIDAGHVGRKNLRKNLNKQKNWDVLREHAEYDLKTSKCFCDHVTKQIQARVVMQLLPTSSYNDFLQLLRIHILNHYFPKRPDHSKGRRGGCPKWCPAVRNKVLCPSWLGAPYPTSDIVRKHFEVEIMEYLDGDVVCQLSRSVIHGGTTGPESNHNVVGRRFKRTNFGHDMCESQISRGVLQCNEKYNSISMRHNASGLTVTNMTQQMISRKNRELISSRKRQKTQKYKTKRMETRKTWRINTSKSKKQASDYSSGRFVSSRKSSSRKKSSQSSKSCKSCKSSKSSTKTKKKKTKSAKKTTNKNVKNKTESTKQNKKIKTKAKKHSNSQCKSIKKKTNKAQSKTQSKSTNKKANNTKNNKSNLNSINNNNNNDNNNNKTNNNEKNPTKNTKLTGKKRKFNQI